MNITLQTNKFNTQQYKPNSNNNKAYYPAPPQTPNFTGKSNLFDPIGRLYKELGYLAGKYITTPLMNSKPMQAIANNKRLQNDKYLFNHISAIGSFITSGTYAVRTLKNDKLDKDRRNTLAINQVLTAIVSTAGMYLIDGGLSKQWDKVMEKYAGKALNDKDFVKNFKNQAKDNKKSLADFIKNNYREAKGKKFVNGLNKEIRGLGLMKKMLIFGLVYRYLVPVAIVPIANKLGDKYLESKKAKEAAKTVNA